jgi:hypothetical protein
MMYLNDVLNGGQTYFPRATTVSSNDAATAAVTTNTRANSQERGFSMVPRKGSALFWFNVRPSSRDGALPYGFGCPDLVPKRVPKAAGPGIERAATERWTVEPLSVHAGLPLRDAHPTAVAATTRSTPPTVKWTATKWLRQANHTLNFS